MFLKSTRKGRLSGRELFKLGTGKVSRKSTLKTLKMRPKGDFYFKNTGHYCLVHGTYTELLYEDTKLLYLYTHLRQLFCDWKVLILQKQSNIWQRFHLYFGTAFAKAISSIKIYLFLILNLLVKIVNISILHSVSFCMQNQTI